MGYGRYSSGSRGSIKSNFSENERKRFIIKQEQSNTWRFMDPNDPYQVTYRHHETDILTVRLVGPLDPATFKRVTPSGRAEWAQVQHWPSATTVGRLRSLCRRHDVPVEVTRAALCVSVPLHKSMIPFAARSFAGHKVCDLTPHPHFDGFFAGYSRSSRWCEVRQAWVHEQSELRIVTVPLESDSSFTLPDVDPFRRAWTGRYDSGESPAADLRHILDDQGGVMQGKATLRVVGQGVQSREVRAALAPSSSLEFSLMTTDVPRSDRPIVFTPAPRQPIGMPSRPSPQDRFNVAAANAVQNWVNPHLKLGDSIGQISLTPHHALRERSSPTDTWISHFIYDRTTHFAEFVTRAGLRGSTPVWQRRASLTALIPALALFASTLPEDVRTARFSATLGLDQYGEMAELYARLDPRLVGYDEEQVPAPVMLEALLKEWPMPLLVGLVQLHESGNISRYAVVENPMLFVSMDPTKNPVLRRDSAWANP